VLPLAKGETPLLDTSTGANNEALDGLQVGSGLSYHEWNASAARGCSSSAPAQS
jgi:hypothetical protein